MGFFLLIISSRHYLVHLENNDLVGIHEHMEPLVHVSFASVFSYLSMISSDNSAIPFLQLSSSILLCICCSYEWEHSNHQLLMLMSKYLGSGGSHAPLAAKFYRFNGPRNKQGTVSLTRLGY
jgi:hypothetical protein